MSGQKLKNIMCKSKQTGGRPPLSGRPNQLFQGPTFPFNYIELKGNVYIKIYIHLYTYKNYRVEMGLKRVEVQQGLTGHIPFIPTN